MTCKIKHPSSKASVGNNEVKNIALLVFCFSAKAEATRKSFGYFHRHGHARKILQKLNTHTENIAVASGLDLFVVNEDDQQGQTFGKFFTHTHKKVFSQGYDYVISITNDCPDISVETINEAIRNFEKNTLVLGPAIDGGEYLMGLHKNTFKEEEFELLPWRTAQLHTSILALSQSYQWQTICLEPLADIDNQKDLYQYVRKNPFADLTLFIQKYLLNIRHFSKHYSFVCTQQYIHRHNPLRAPPF